uniref:Uncharacterized protein n=2 Tax=Oryza TaxID=4527 RepID=A0A0E0J942_ORYNI
MEGRGAGDRACCTRGEREQPRLQRAEGVGGTAAACEGRRRRDSRRGWERRWRRTGRERAAAPRRYRRLVGVLRDGDARLADVLRGHGGGISPGAVRTGSSA